MTTVQLYKGSMYLIVNDNIIDEMLIWTNENNVTEREILDRLDDWNSQYPFSKCYVDIVEQILDSSIVY